MSTFHRVYPQDIPKTTDRMVILSEAELSRLKQILAENIRELHTLALALKVNAKNFKARGHSELAASMYKGRRATLKKATNLGTVQHALKHTTLSNSELLEQFESVGMVVGMIKHNT